MRSAIARALRGTLAAVSLLAFVGLFLALEARVTSPPVLGGLLAVGTGALLAAGGRPALRRLLGRAGRGDDAETARDDDTGPAGDAWLDEADDDTPWTDRSDRAGDVPEADWAPARLEPALGDAWNRWSDVTLTVGLAALGVGSFALLAAYPGENPPLGLLVTGLFGINGALVSLAFVFK
ncbi:hypothetical protein EXE46_03605 [Halorubrum sp. GN11_10-6_MGM]|uniref:hypothetical protein n=1 Tax=Halorubrum sp. GN11_10-6_MGM TaxID=2518112 RepID=UPI0010F5546E|nr:hypothetical protein [Halorubrum sp. GN11_10-6_MGM]TKX75544.1 hypothetical protein EXE46_03605 [Halorubrum sp. GN11_10-6_MGM]